MNIDFTPEVQALVQQAINTGRLHRPEDAVEEAISLWAERERRQAQAHTVEQSEIQAAVARILELRKGNLLTEGLTIRDLIHEGRA